MVCTVQFAVLSNVQCAVKRLTGDLVYWEKGGGREGGRREGEREGGEKRHHVIAVSLYNFAYLSSLW